MIDQKVGLFSFHSEQFDKESLGTFLTWPSLYNWAEERNKGKEHELALRYSKYKYGDYTEICRFSHELETLIRHSTRQEIQDNANWVVFTPPYSSVEPAVRLVGVEIAKAFNIPFIDFRADPAADREAQYAALPTLEARLQARLSVKTTISDAISVEGKHALVIDDLIATGVTAEYMRRVLLREHHLGCVTGFSFINLAGESPDSEERVNRFLILSGNLETLISILSDPLNIINRHVLKSLYGEDRGLLDANGHRFSPSVMGKLEEARDKYFGQVT